MNRKLHDTALALTLSGTLAALAFVAGNPQPTATVSPGTVHSGVAARTATPLRLATAQPGKSGRARRIRHSMAMPFFSFASRG